MEWIDAQSVRKRTTGTDKGLLLTCLSGVLGKGIYFYEQRVLLDEHLVHVHEHLQHVLGHVLEPDLPNHSHRLLLAQPLRNVDGLVYDCTGVLGGHVLDVHAAVRGGDQDRALKLGKGVIIRVGDCWQISLTLNARSIITAK